MLPGMAFDPGLDHPAPGAPHALIALFTLDGALVHDAGPSLPTRAALADVAPRETVFVGFLDGVPVEAAFVAGAEVALPTAPLRSLHGRLHDEQWSVAGRAFQLAEWDRTHRFCGGCGATTVRASGERARVCPDCGLRAYPRHSPAVIMRVTRGDEVLLGRAARFPDGMYSTLAGFVDPGESAEEAVRREVREEAGVEIDEPRWFGSQSWPFPHSLMLGFTAEWSGGDLHRDDDELEDLAWFRRGDLPTLPPPASIARRLLDDWIAGS